MTTAAAEAVSSHHTACMPDITAKAFQELTVGSETGQTIEARVIRDADKFETLKYLTWGHGG